MKSLFDPYISMSTALNFRRGLKNEAIKRRPEWKDSSIPYSSFIWSRAFHDRSLDPRKVTIVFEDQTNSDWGIRKSASFLRDTGISPNAQVDKYHLIDVSNSAIKKVEEARKLLTEVSESLAKETNFLIDKIAFFQDTSDRSFTHAFWLGLVFIKHEFLLKCTPVQLATLLVHEASHQILFIEQTQDPLVVDINKPAYSPLRREVRTVSGVLHSLYAIFKMILFLDLCHSRYFQDECLKDLKKYCSIFKENLDVLSREDLTEQGLGFIDTMRAVEKKFSRVYPS